VNKETEQNVEWQAPAFQDVQRKKRPNRHTKSVKKASEGAGQGE